MTCKQCGNYVPENIEVCPTCGTIQAINNQQNYYQPQQQQAQYYQQPQQPVYYAPQPVQQEDPNKTYAIVSLIFGIASFFFGFIFSIVAIVFGAMYEKQPVFKTEECKKFAKAGKVCGIVSLALNIVGIVVCILLYILAFTTAVSIGGLDFLY